MQTQIYYYGTCERCHKLISTPITVEVDDKQLQEECDCGGKINWTNYSHSYKPHQPRKKNVIWIIMAIVAIVLLSIGFFIHNQVSRTYTSEEMAFAIQETNSKSAAEILEIFQQAGIKDETLAKLFDSSPWTIKRIRNKQSIPVPSFESVIQGTYTLFLLKNKRKNIFLITLKLNPGANDQFYANKDPRKEVMEE